LLINILEEINKIVYNLAMNSKEFKRWFAEQGATFDDAKGSTSRSI